MEGWTKFYRKLTKWKWYKNQNVKGLFFHLLLTVNYEEREWNGIIIKPGQTVTTRKDLVEETGIKEQSLRTALKKLISTGEISVETTNKYTFITVLNWEKYQPTGISSFNEEELEIPIENNSSLDDETRAHYDEIKDRVSKLFHKND